MFCAPGGLSIVVKPRNYFNNVNLGISGLAERDFFLVQSKNWLQKTPSVCTHNPKRVDVERKWWPLDATRMKECTVPQWGGEKCPLSYATPDPVYGREGAGGVEQRHSLNTTWEMGREEKKKTYLEIKGEEPDQRCIVLHGLARFSELALYNAAHYQVESYILHERQNGSTVAKSHKSSSSHKSSHKSQVKSSQSQATQVKSIQCKLE